MWRRFPADAVLARAGLFVLFLLLMAALNGWLADQREDGGRAAASDQGMP